MLFRRSAKIPPPRATAPPPAPSPIPRALAHLILSPPRYPRHAPTQRQNRVGFRLYLNFEISNDSTGIRPGRRDQPPDEIRRHSRTSPLAGANPRRNRGRPNDHSRQQSPSEIQAQTHVHRPSFPHQNQRQHGGLAGIVF